MGKWLKVIAAMVLAAGTVAAAIVNARCSTGTSMPAPAEPSADHEVDFERVAPRENSRSPAATAPGAVPSLDSDRGDVTATQEGAPDATQVQVIGEGNDVSIEAAK